MAATGCFMYFAFGSNLLKERLELANPSATFFTTGRLKLADSFGIHYRHLLTLSNGRDTLVISCPDSGGCTGSVLTDGVCSQDYKLNFGLWDKHADSAWHGGVATIEYHPGAEVWGVVWTLSIENLTSLDNQEGVDKGLYSPLEVTVETDKGLILCRTYQINNFHASPPSPQYKQVVYLGAVQNRLPLEYLKKLEAIRTNNYTGPSLLDQIKLVSQ